MKSAASASPTFAETSVWQRLQCTYGQPFHLRRGHVSSYTPFNALAVSCQDVSNTSRTNSLMRVQRAQTLQNRLLGKAKTGATKNVKRLFRFWKNLPKNTRILPEFSLCGSTLFGGIEVPNMSHLLEPEVHFNTMFVCFCRYLRQILRLALGAIFAKDHSLQDLKLLASWSSQVWVNYPYILWYLLIMIMLLMTMVVMVTIFHEWWMINIGHLAAWGSLILRYEICPQYHAAAKAIAQRIWKSALTEIWDILRLKLFNM